jgi:predicted DNA-binding protein YlxM (UPF0122 family)
MKMSESDVLTPFDELPSIIENVPSRVRDMATLRGLGYSLREIAELFRVSPQAISLTLTRHRRRLQALETAVQLTNLLSRAVNVLGRHQITTREQAQRADVLNLLLAERNCGRKTREEIRRWMADPPELTPEPMLESAVA